MILVIDLYDSFVFNLARYVTRLGQPTQVVRHDRLNEAAIRALKPSAVILSPGPCGPAQVPDVVEWVRRLGPEVPLLGVCLGHQILAAAVGGQVVRAPRPVHGRSTAMTHTGQGLLAGLPSPMAVGRYHSLVVDAASLPDCLDVQATSEDGIIMAMAHRDWPAWGVQFHPESVLTEGGFALLANFLEAAGLRVPRPLPEMGSELVAPPVRPLPTGPVPH